MKVKTWGLITSLFSLLVACTNDEVKPGDSDLSMPKIVINEFMASNLYSYQDPENEGEFDDWIEIYNLGNTPVNLGGLYISDNKKYKTKYKIPTTDPDKTTIQPGGYLILWADSDLGQGPLHVDFKLSADGEDLGLYTADGRTIDEITFGTQKTDISAGRLPNGTGAWTTFAKPTPGSANK